MDQKQYRQRRRTLISQYRNGWIGWYAYSVLMLAAWHKHREWINQ